MTFSKEFCWPFSAKGIIGRDLKFAGYIHHHKILPGNIFGLILKNMMAAMGIFLLSARSFVVPLKQRVLYVEISNLQDIFGLILKNKTGSTGVSLSVMKNASISFIIGPRGLACEVNL